jgi:hypothetical protein
LQRRTFDALDQPRITFLLFVVLCFAGFFAARRFDLDQAATCSGSESFFRNRLI